MQLFINTTFRSLPKDPGAIAATSLFQGLLKFAPFVASLSQNTTTPNLVGSLLTKFKALNAPANVAMTAPEQNMPVGQLYIFNGLGEPVNFVINRLKSVLTLYASTSNAGSPSPVNLDALLANDGNGQWPLLRSRPRFQLQVTGQNSLNTITPFSDTSLSNDGGLQNVPVISIDLNGGDDPSFLANCNRLFYSTQGNLKKVGAAGWCYEIKGLSADQITAINALRTAYGAITFSASVCNYYELEVDGAPQANGSNPEFYVVTPSEWSSKSFPCWVNPVAAGTIADVTIGSAPGFTSAVNGFTECLCVPVGKLGGSQSPYASKTSAAWGLTAQAAGPLAITNIDMETRIAGSVFGFVPQLAF